LSCIGSDEDEESLDDEEYVQLAESESKELEQIEAALQRIREGSYGQCEGCSEEIADARLEALPCATLCIVCQRAEEQAGAE
jgi:DnaK suppressor protein